MVDSEQFRQAWARFATGVSVVTSIERDGGVHGMTAQGICSVSMDPLLALVCVGHNRHSLEHISESRRFCINILNVDQQGIAEHFALPPERRDASLDIPLSFTAREPPSSKTAWRAWIAAWWLITWPETIPYSWERSTRSG